MKKALIAVVACIALALLGVTGCATKASVKQETVAVQEQPEPEVQEIATSENEAVTQYEPCTTLEGALARAEKLGKDGLHEATEAEETILFEFDSDGLSAAAKVALDDFVKLLMKTDKTFFVEFQGHTDDFGSDDYNFQLGLARARAAMGYLYSQYGIPLERMNGFSCGESKPVADNSTDAGRAQNRRVTLVVVE